MQDGAYDVALGSNVYGVELEKVWRNSDGCAEDDTVYEEARVFETGTIRSGPIGTGTPEDAAKQVGTNVELRDDPRGRFRFSRISVGLFQPADADVDAEAAFAEALTVANRVVDSYRFVTSKAYLPPVQTSDVEITEVVEVLTGAMFVTANLGRGITIALINESRATHEAIRDHLANGFEVPLHSQIMLTSERMLLEGLTRQAVIDAVTSLEVFVDDLLHDELVVKAKMTEDEFDSLERTEGATLGDKMKVPLETAIGWRASADDELWKGWVRANKIRREATHRGATINEDDARVVIDAVHCLVDAIRIHCRA